MKTQELRKIIREEIQSVLKEQFDYTHVKPYLPKLSEIIGALELMNEKIEDDGPLSEEIEDALDSLRDLYKKAQNSRSL